MPRVEIPVTPVTVKGTTPPAQVTGVPAEDHFVKPGSGAVLLEVQNVGSTEGRVVTLKTPGEVGGVDIDELEVTVPKEATRLIRIEANEAFRQKGGQVHIDVASAELKFRAYRV
jgi:hypothetical protein